MNFELLKLSLMLLEKWQMSRHRMTLLTLSVGIQKITHLKSLGSSDGSTFCGRHALLQMIIF